MENETPARINADANGYISSSATSGDAAKANLGTTLAPRRRSRRIQTLRVREEEREREEAAQRAREEAVRAAEERAVASFVQHQRRRQQERRKARVATMTPVREGKWTKAQLAALNTAYLSLDPAARGFWRRVAAQVDGKSAAECQAQYELQWPTPVNKMRRLSKRRSSDSDGSDSGDGDDKPKVPLMRLPAKGKAPQKRRKLLRKMMRAANLKHGGDDYCTSTPMRSKLSAAAEGKIDSILPSVLEVDALDSSSSESEDPLEQAVLASGLQSAKKRTERALKRRRRAKERRQRKQKRAKPNAAKSEDVEEESADDNAILMAPVNRSEVDAYVLRMTGKKSRRARTGQDDSSSSEDESDSDSSSGEEDKPRNKLEGGVRVEFSQQALVQGIQAELYAGAGTREGLMMVMEDPDSVAHAARGLSQSSVLVHSSGRVAGEADDDGECSDESADEYF